MRCLHVLLVACASTLGVASASTIGQGSVLFGLRRKATPLYRPESAGLATAIQLRGGGQDAGCDAATEAATSAIQIMSPDLAAKIGTLGILLQGSAFMLASPEAFGIYGLKDLTKVQAGAGEYFGTWRKFSFKRSREPTFVLSPHGWLTVSVILHALCLLPSQ
jgi:hypothetical protein